MVRLKEGESRVYNVPLRQRSLTSPKWRRTKKAVTVLRDFLKKHTKSDDIKLSKFVNEEVWSRGGKNPPAKISVKVTKEKDNVIKVDLTKHSAREQRQIKKLEAQQKTAEEEKKSVEKEEKKVDEIEEEKKKKAKVTKQQEKDIQKNK
jgi:large subunit ribosomal protein L31e